MGLLCGFVLWINPRRVLNPARVGKYTARWELLLRRKPPRPMGTAPEDGNCSGCDGCSCFMHGC